MKALTKVNKVSKCYLSTSDREVGEAAILLIDMTGVRLQALALVEVPQFQSAKMRTLFKPKCH